MDPGVFGWLGYVEAGGTFTPGGAEDCGRYDEAGGVYPNWGPPGGVIEADGRLL